MEVISTTIGWTIVGALFGQGLSLDTSVTADEIVILDRCMKLPYTSTMGSSLMYSILVYIKHICLSARYLAWFSPTCENMLSSLHIFLDLKSLYQSFLDIILRVSLLLQQLFRPENIATQVGRNFVEFISTTIGWAITGFLMGQEGIQLNFVTDGV